MLAIIQAHQYRQKLELQAQKLSEHLATLEINKRREYLRQAALMGGQHSKKRSEEYTIYMAKVIKNLTGNNKPNIKRVVKLLKKNDHLTINGAEFTDSTLYKLIKKIEILKGSTIWSEK